MKKTLLLLFLFQSIFLFSQNTGDYRTVFSSGFSINWQDNSSWETFNGTSWVTATATPDASSGVITIRDTITVYSSITVDEVFVENGGFIRTYVSLTLNSGAGDEITFKNGGGFLPYAPVLGTNTSSNLQVESGGYITTNGGNFDSFVTTNIENGGTFEIDGSGSFTHHGILNNYGTIQWKNQQGITASNKIGTINNYNTFTINSTSFSSSPFEQHYFQEQVLNNYGTINISGGIARISFSDLGSNNIRYSHFNNYGIINVLQGILSITQEAHLKGTVNVSQDASFYLYAYKENTTYADHVMDSFTIQGLGFSNYFGNIQVTSKNAWLNEDSATIQFQNFTGPGTLFMKNRYSKYGVYNIVTGTIENQIGGNVYINDFSSRLINSNFINRGKVYFQNGGINGGNGTFSNYGKIYLKNMEGNVSFSGPKLMNYDSLILDDNSYYLTLSSEFEQSSNGVLQILKNNQRFFTSANSVEGKVYLAAGTTLTLNTNGLNFKGDSFVCNGSIPFPHVNFNGLSQQYLKGNGSMHSLVLDNFNDLHLSSSFYLVSQMNLTQGKLFLNEYDLTLGNFLSTIASKSSYVVTNDKGRLVAQVGASNKTFFIGTANNAFPVTLKNSGTTDVFKARVIPRLYSLIDTVNEIGAESIVSEKGIDATWFISEDVVGGSNMTIQLNYLPIAILPNYDSTTSRVMHFTNSKWSESPMVGSAYMGNEFRSVTRSGITNFSPFAIWSGSFSALPVDFLNFKAIRVGDKNNLNWQTAFELNNEKFEIWRRLDSESNFNKIGEINGAGNSSKLLSYQFIDFKDFNSNLVYYKICQVDFDGKQSCSNTEVVHLEKRNAIGDVFKVYPNPTHGNLSIKIENNGLLGNNIRIMDLTGKVIKTVVSESPNSTTIDFADLANGIYLIEMIVNDQRKVVRIVKQ